MVVGGEFVVATQEGERVGRVKFSNGLDAVVWTADACNMSASTIVFYFRIVGRRGRR